MEYITNGVQGASDYKVHWLGWEAQNVELLLDLGGMIPTREVTISSLYDPKSWIFHPKSVTCYYSTDGVLFSKLGQHEVIGQQKTEQVTRDYHFFLPDAPLRYIKFAIQATLQNPSWHPSAGGKSWVFVDEIVVH